MAVPPQRPACADFLALSTLSSSLAFSALWGSKELWGEAQGPATDGSLMTFPDCFPGVGVCTHCFMGIGKHRPQSRGRQAAAIALTLLPPFWILEGTIGPPSSWFLGGALCLPQNLWPGREEPPPGSWVAPWNQEGSNSTRLIPFALLPLPAPEFLHGQRGGREAGSKGPKLFRPRASPKPQQVPGVQPTERARLLATQGYCALDKEGSQRLSSLFRIGLPALIQILQPLKEEP